jgi:hypothetical protein
LAQEWRRAGTLAWHSFHEHSSLVLESNRPPFSIPFMYVLSRKYCDVQKREVYDNIAPFQTR